PDIPVTSDYIQIGEFPDFIIYDSSENAYYSAVPSELFPFTTNAINQLDSLDVYSDCNGDLGGLAELDECGVCNGPGIVDGTCDCDGSVEDCLGECGGPAVLDECGQCQGNGFDFCDDDNNGVSNIEQWGYGAHTVEVSDVPEDQGNQLYIEFEKSFYDSDGLSRSENYTIEVLEDSEWVTVMSFGAYASDRYKVLVPTLKNNEVSEFRIISGMDEGNFLTLEQISGISVDNIIPSAPDNFNTNLDENGNISLSWDYSQDIDFNYHKLTDVNNEVLFTTSNSAVIDFSGLYNEYSIQSVDVNENLSEGLEFIGIHRLLGGANLVSFPIIDEGSSIENLFDCSETSLIVGQGEITSCDSFGGWVGNLNEISSKKGYWVYPSQSHINSLSERGVISLSGYKYSDSSYELYSGNNLISHPCSNSIYIESLLSSNQVRTVIGAGEASLYIEDIGWVGSLSILDPGKGYWLQLYEDALIDFELNCNQNSFLASAERSVYSYKDTRFVQSSKQAFYFFENIENAEDGDIIESYCGDNLTGSRKYLGLYTDVPVMGDDGQVGTEHYCKNDEVPGFRVVKTNGQIFDLMSNDISGWSNNKIVVVNNSNLALQEPDSFSLGVAYPNPFNPVTNISFEIPYESKVSLEVFSLNGSKLDVLSDKYFRPGKHTVAWDASNFSSGIYILKMKSEGFSKTQKLVLVK
ncbi:MAG: hypothetical protein CMG00_07880, partial [Candidatus Marinimicrobia bacterium]|nr:hypothetical protein [Candidatus Neomarinimicrobiota bacterium]